MLAICLQAVVLAATPGCSADSPAQPQEAPQTTAPASGAPAAADKPQATGTRAPATETGLASFIADKFSGQKTASGEIYNPTMLVAAHPSYPLGTLVRVTNPANGRMVEVKVIDRSAAGPQRPIIDLSRAAAVRLDFIKQGTVTVNTEVMQWGAGTDVKHP